MSPVSHRSLAAVVVVAAVLTVAVALPLQAAIFQSPPPAQPPPAAEPLQPQPPAVKPSQLQTPSAKFGPARCSGWFYSIRRGDTLSRIAARYDVSVNDLMRCNGLTTTRIYAGRSLLIPGRQPPPEPEQAPAPAQKLPSGCYYTVQHGDTLGSIAARYDTTSWALQSLNYIPNRNVVYAGQALRVPCGVNPGPETDALPGPEPGPSQNWYQVRSGDTVSKLAARFGVSNSSLIEANNLEQPYTIYIGQWLQIP